MAVGEQRGGEATVGIQIRCVPLHRRVCTIGPECIEVRPSRWALLLPLLGLALSVGLFTLIAFYLNALPFGLLAFLLLVGVVILPFSGMGVVYSAIGANVIIDRRKESAAWQQGVLGLGIGTQELVPFWKIAEVVVQEAGHGEEAGGLRPLEEIAQWEVAVVKTNGKRLVVGGLTVLRSQAETGQAALLQVAEAISQMTGAPLRVEAPEALAEEGWEEDEREDEEYEEETEEEEES